MAETVTLTPAQTASLDAAAAAGQSPAEKFHVEHSKLPTADPNIDAPDFAADLAKAKASDLEKAGKTAPVKEEISKDKPVEEPKASPLEWRPKGEKASQQWDEMKTRHKTELEALRSELTTLKSQLQTKAPPEELQALAKERDQYRELIRDLAIERDPDFARKYDSRKTAAISAAKLAAGDKAGRLEELLKSPNSPWRDEQINALMEELPASSQRRINAALGVMEQIDVERDTEIAQARATFESKQAGLSRQQEQRQQELHTVFEKTLSHWTDGENGMPFLTPIEGNAEHNKAVEATRDLARNIFSGKLSAEELAGAALWAASGERILAGWQAAVEERDKLKATLDKMRGVTPGAGRVARDGKVSDEAPKPGTQQYDDYFRRELQRAQSADRNPAPA